MRAEGITPTRLPQDLPTWAGTSVSVLAAVTGIGLLVNGVFSTDKVFTKIKKLVGGAVALVGSAALALWIIKGSAVPADGDKPGGFGRFDLPTANDLFGDLKRGYEQGKSRYVDFD